jgi:hypothetical protein
MRPPYVVAIRAIRTSLAAALCALLLGPSCAHKATSPIDKVADARWAQAARVAREAGLSADVQRFLGRAAAGVAATFTVTYSDGGGGPGTPRSVVVQRPPERRVDVVNKDSTESLVRLRSGVYRCRVEDPEPWRCSKAGTTDDPDLGVFSSTQIAQTVDTLVASKAEYRFTVVAKRVAGARARCLLSTPVLHDKAVDELCIAANGALLRVHTAKRNLEAVRYRPKADPALLRLPGKLDSPSPSP